MEEVVAMTTFITSFPVLALKILISTMMAALVFCSRKMGLQVSDVFFYILVEKCSKAWEKFEKQGL